MILLAWSIVFYSFTFSLYIFFNPKIVSFVFQSTNKIYQTLFLIAGYHTITNVKYLFINTSVFILIIAVVNNDSKTQQIPFINQKKKSNYCCDPFRVVFFITF